MSTLITFGSLALLMASPFLGGGAVALLAVTGFVGGIVMIHRSRKSAARNAELHQVAYAQAYAAQQQAYQEQVRLYERQQYALGEQERRQRYERLVATYGQDHAASLLRRKLWIGAPEQAAIEAFGSPDEVEERALKTKTKRILKYRDAVHAGRYSVKVTVENGAVVGWEDKDA